jgi:Predicted membrane protein (DUF2232)
MHAPIPIGLAAGLCSALLFAAGARGNVMLALLLFMLAPLPTFLAGLGWGPKAVSAASVIGLLVTGLLRGGNPLLVYFASVALPIPILCWLAHLRRPSTSSSDGSAVPVLEWFPAGEMVAWIAVMAGLYAALSIFSMGGDVETVSKAVRALIDHMVKAWVAAGGKAPTEVEAEALTRVFVRALPAMTAVTWMFMISTNLWLAGRILRTSGRLFREWPMLPALHLPPLMTLGFAVALILSFGSGIVALFATGFASAFGMAYALLGLAVIHWITYGKAGRSFTLATSYVAALMLAPYGTLPIVILGFLEPVLRLRSRTAGPPPPVASVPPSAPV